MKTEALTTGARQQFKKLDKTDEIAVAGVTIPFAKTLKILCMAIDDQLTFNKHPEMLSGHAITMYEHWDIFTHT